jgi:hypothetical protein
MESKIASQFAGFAPAIKFTVCCPSCGNMDIPENKRSGFLINRKNNLAAEIINLKNQISNLNPKKEQATMIIMDSKLLKLEQELSELGQKEIWFNNEFIKLRI